VFAVVIFENDGEGLYESAKDMLAKAEVSRRPGLCVISPAFRGAVPRSSCDVLLLPGEKVNDVTGHIKHRFAVTYGHSPRDTISLSSFGLQGPVLEVRRELPLEGGVFSERGEYPLRVCGSPEPHRIMVLGGILLLCGGHIRDVTGIYIHH
jgi:hypothetical protein